MAHDPSSSSSSASDFESHRGRLFGLAYRMLGVRADAEDVVQETFVRWHTTDRSAIRNTEAWLVTAATRLSIDRLRARRTERESYVGPWLPEPIMSDQVPPPDHNLDLASDLSVAFLVLLEKLGPDERAAFLLHDVFDVGYPEIAGILGKSEAACRQMIHRARERVRGDGKRFDASEGAKADLLRTFAAAVGERDEQALLALFTPDATWTADGGGRVPASPRAIEGAERITKLVLGLGKGAYRNQGRMTLAAINGESGLLVYVADKLVATMSIETDGERIRRVFVVVNPDKLGTTAPAH